MHTLNTKCTGLQAYIPNAENEIDTHAYINRNINYGWRITK